MTTQPLKRIPYAIADYRRLREDNAYYVDKTRFIPLIEAAPYYLFCIRPRRFGKTLWLTLLDYYYDVNEKENFDALFGDTYIGQHPTADRNSYLTLTFNFANVDPSLTQVRDSFEKYGAVMIENFISLLVYFGLLTFAGEQAGRPLLRIPNRTVKDLLYGFIRDGFQDVNIFRVDPWRLASLLSDMAYTGEWQPFFDFLAAEIKQQTSIRDYLNGEKVIQGFLLSYLNVSQFFLTWPESAEP